MKKSVINRQVSIVAISLPSNIEGQTQRITSKLKSSQAHAKSKR